MESEMAIDSTSEPIVSDGDAQEPAGPASESTSQSERKRRRRMRSIKSCQKYYKRKQRERMGLCKRLKKLEEAVDKVVAQNERLKALMSVTVDAARAQDEEGIRQVIAYFPQSFQTQFTEFFETGFDLD